jgi:hypothetical protein
MNKNTKKLLDSFKEYPCPNAGRTYCFARPQRLVHPQQNLKQFIAVTSEGSNYYRYQCPWCHQSFLESEVTKIL